MIILGIILLVAALLFHIHLLWVLGAIVLVIGLIFLVLGFAGHAVFGRRHYW